MEYYVYVLLNPLKVGNYRYGEYVFNYEPFYVGKGKKNRIVDTISENKNKFKKAIINKIINDNEKPYAVIIKNHLLESEAFILECELIALFGRRDLGKGTLTNFTDGGEGCTGILQSEATKEKRKKSLIPYRQHFKSEDFKNKMSGIYDERRKTEEFKNYCKNVSEKHMGCGNPMYGKTTSTIQKEAVKKAHEEGKIQLTEEGRNKIIENGKKRKGTKNSIKRIDSKKYELVSPNGENFIIFGAVNLQRFCKDRKLQFHVIKNNIGLITNELINGNKINAKNTLEWKINN